MQRLPSSFALMSPLRCVGEIDRGLSSLELSRTVLGAMELVTEWTSDMTAMQQYLGGFR
jgi:hypothetical protein